MRYNELMNILFLIFSFNMGGIERLLIDMSSKMTMRGHHVFLCVINEDYTSSLFAELNPAVQVELLHRHPGKEGVQNANAAVVGSREAMLHLASFVKSHHIDILHCHGVNCVLFATAAKLVSPRLVILNTVHDTGNYRSYSKSKVFFSNLLLDETIAISETVRSEILSRGLHPDKVITIYNGVDTSLFTCKKAVPSHDCPRIGCVARFFPEKKGQDLLVLAIEKLLQKKPDKKIHCIIAGDIYKGQQESFEKLRQYIQEQGLEPYITLQEGIAPQQVAAFLQTLDLFVLPSRYEGFGISLIEAMACGLPCVASNLDGPAEILQEEALGVLFTPGDADALSESIDLALQRIEDGFYDARYIADKTNARFGAEKMTDAHLSLYRKLLKK